jgi:hypothetical protein
MKKKTWVMAAGLLGMVLFGLTACKVPTDSESGTGVSGDLIYKYEGSEITIIRYTGPKGVSISIPSTIDGRTVTAIGDNVFYMKDLTGVTLPATLRTIGWSAFYHNQLTSVTFPPSLTTIGDTAFQDNLLGSLAFPPSLTTIGMGAFNINPLGDTGIVAISASVASIGEMAFMNNSGLTAINVDPYNPRYKSVDGVLFTKDGKTLMAYPTGKPQKTYTIPAGVQVIGKYTFYMAGMTSVIFSDSLATIEDGAFSDNQLTGITFPASLTTIGKDAFRGNQFTSVTLPASLASVGNYAFIQNPIMSVVIGTNAGIMAGSLPGRFYSDYTAQGKAAGTYTRADTGDNTPWTKL